MDMCPLKGLKSGGKGKTSGGSLGKRKADEEKEVNDEKRGERVDMKDEKLVVVTSKTKVKR